jgi:hypothetical protein
MSIIELEIRCDTLRNDLKLWEKQFAAQHNGKKAAREDIKADTTICEHTHDCRPHFVISADCSQLKNTRNTAG